MITHRAMRDEQRCAKKYGATWEKYLKARELGSVAGRKGKVLVDTNGRYYG